VDVNSAVSLGWDMPVAMDDAGDVWTSTFTGLVCVRAASCHTLGPTAGFPPGHAVTTTFRDREGRTWIGTDGAGLGQLVDGKFVGSSAPLLRSGSIVSMAQTADGRLWVGVDARLIRYDGVSSVDWTSKLALAPLDKGVASLCADDAGDLWVGTDRSVCRISGSTITRLTPGRGLPSTYTRAGVIARGLKGSIFVGMRQGLLRFEHGRLACDYQTAIKLPAIELIDIHEDVDGGVWLATWGTGLYRIKPGKWTHIDRRDGLYADNIHHIEIDDSGNMWIGSAKGIFRVRLADIDAYADGVRKSFTCFPYGAAAGASGGQCWAGTQPSGMKTPDGTVWFACVNGLVACHMVRRARNAPTALIEDILTNHVAAAPTPGRGESRIDVPPGSGALEIHYTGFDYFAPESTRFRYRLKGLDETWQSAGNRRVAYYTNVPPGSYTFLVSACNDEGAWGPEVGVGIHIEPRFYQTTWFKIVAGCLVVFCVFVVFDYRHRQMLARNRALELAVDERTQQLSQAHTQVVEQNDELQTMHAELEAQNEELVGTQLELERQNAKLESLATTDGLTGLKNHRAFHDRLVAEWAGSERYGTPLSLILLDVDKFKQYNDTYGHPAGDDVLKRVGALLMSTSRETDFVARYGGEEFVIVLSHTTSEAAMEMAERCRAAIEGETWPLRPVTASFGVSTYRPGLVGQADLIREADGALYVSKGSGRNCVTHAQAVDAAVDENVLAS